MCGLLDLIWAFGPRIRQHSICKRTWPMATFLRLSYYELSFHLMQVFWSTWIHLLHGLDATITLNLCLMPYSKLIKEYVIWYMRRQRRLLVVKLLAWMWLSLFDALLDIANCLLIIVWFKVQRESGFSIWHSCLLDCIPLVRSFQLLTFKFLLRISLFISSHFLNFKISPQFQIFFSCDF